jgi:hypothetical protein
MSPIEEILQEEYAERMLAKAENQTNRLSKKLSGETDERHRDWFQTPQQRKAEKEPLNLTTNSNADACKSLYIPIN